MIRILVTLWDGGGNVAPILGLSSELTARGHEVRVLADRSLAASVAAGGAGHAPWTTAPQRSSPDPATEFIRDYEARTSFGQVGRIRDRLIAGPADRFFVDTRSEIERFGPDVILVENLLFGAQVAAEASAVPFASIVPNVYPGRTAGVPPFGLGLMPRDDAIGRLRDRGAAAVGRRLWDRGLPGLNALRRDAGLAPLRTLFDALELPDRVLVLTSAAFEFGGGADVPDNVVYCGPRLDDPDWTEPWSEPTGDGPLVLASLSTTTQNQDSVLPRVIAALGDLPVRGVVTTGPSATTAATAHANVTVVPSAPHSRVLERATVAISHGGHGTVIKSLAAGVPVLCLPVSRDQPDTAARLVGCGAGIRLRPNASARSIARAVETLLGDPAYRLAAGRMAEAIAADLAEDRAALEVEALAASRGR